MTVFAVLLTTTLLAAGLWAVVCERWSRRRISHDGIFRQPRHVRIVKVPYDWEEEWER